MRPSHLLKHLATVAVVLASPAASAAPATPESPGYSLTATWSPGGEGGWDYLIADAAAHRLYFGRSTRVVALDTETGKVAGEVPDTPGIHGVALAPELGRGFTSNGRDSSVTIFDLASFATIAKVHIDGRNPDAILYDPGTKRVFTMNAGSRNATAIDATTGKVLATFDLGGRPEFAVADGKGRVFVNLEDSSAVVSFDASTFQLGARWSLAPGEEPTGLAIDREHRRLFSVCSNQKMIVLDADDGRVLADLPIGKGTDAAAYDSGTQLAFSSNGEGTLTVVREDSPKAYRVVGTVPTQVRARTMALDPKSHRVYLATASFGEAPPATAENPRPRPPMVPGSFVILVFDRTAK
jgi:DNA-binding beta-propeller fold protein YncE